MKSKITYYALTGLQIVAVLLWIMVGFYSGDEGLNLQKFNILPIPNLGSIISFVLMFAAVSGLQKLKTRFGVEEKIG